MSKKGDSTLLIVAGIVLAYTFFRDGAEHVATDIIPLDEPSLVQWAESEGVMALQL